SGLNTPHDFIAFPFRSIAQGVDIIIADTYNNAISAFMNLDGVGGMWSSRTVIASASFPQFIVHADLDLDGRSDLFFADVKSQTALISLNNFANETELFQTPQVISTFSNNAFYDASNIDADGDGDDDLILADLNGKSIHLFTNLCDPASSSMPF